MLILKKVAVTGGLSSGKSSVCKILKDLGAYVVDADEIVHQLLTPQSPVAHEILALLGEEIKSGKTFDRAQIAQKVFTNKEKLQSLEKILHPAVLKEIENQYNQVKTTYPLFVAEVPLLYEIESAHLFDHVLVVTAKAPIAKDRFTKKTLQPEKEFEMRMIHQLDPKEKMARADTLIENNGSFEELQKQVTTFYKQITQD